MGTQLSLPASWARQFVSMPDPRDRLDALEHAKLTARTEIRKVLTGLKAASGRGKATSWILTEYPVGNATTGSKDFMRWRPAMAA